MRNINNPEFIELIERLPSEATVKLVVADALTTASERERILNDLRAQLSRKNSHQIILVIERQ